MALTHHISVGEVKALYALVDAADDAGYLLASPVQRRWLEIKHSFGKLDHEAEGAFLWQFLVELEEAGAIKGSWIQSRWNVIKSQVERAKELTSHPFDLSVNRRST